MLRHCATVVVVALTGASSLPQREAGKMKCLMGTSKFFRTLQEQMAEEEEEEDYDEEESD